jgi:hypothetical protein
MDIFSGGGNLGRKDAESAADFEHARALRNAEKAHERRVRQAIQRRQSLLLARLRAVDVAHILKSSNP